MSSEETIESRQEYELEVLQSIYVDDIKDLRGKSVWNKWKPLDVSLTLTPPKGSSSCDEIHAQVDLHVICSDKYPDVPPCISFENPRGISLTVLDKFKKELEMQAREISGEVMIHGLAERVRTFLHEHNKPGPKSFYEEMIVQNRQREQAEREKRQQESDRTRQYFLTEVQQLQEIHKLESKKRREQRLSSENSSESSDVVRRRSSSGSRWFNNSCEASDELLCGHQSTKTIEFCNLIVLRGGCINHSKENRIIYSGMSTENGQLFNVVEWCIDMKSEHSIVLRQVSNIENEFQYLLKLKHHNLVHYLSFNYEVEKDENRVIVRILQEFIFGVNCRNLYLCHNIPIEMDMLRLIAEGVLSALEFLHRNNVIHRDVSSSSVNICTNGMVKLSNYSLDTRLSDLATCEHTSTSHSKKTDIYKFGQLMLSLVQGSDVDEEKFVLPHNMTEELRDFLEKSLYKEEKDRYSASQLLNHPFLKVPLSKFSPFRDGDEKLVNKRDASPDPQGHDVQTPGIKMLTQSHTNGQSRVEKEFVLLDHLGKGAYGDVLKVQNKLDQRDYALKCIELNPRNKQINKKIIREVKLLSRLNHENVVRYYNSWIETGVINKEDESSSSEVPTTTTSSNKKEIALNNDDSLIEMMAPPMRNAGWSLSYGSASKVIVDECSSSDDDSSDDEDWLGLEALENSIEFEDSKMEMSKTLDVIDSITTDTPDTSVKLTREIQFMYIQMEFCEKSTLRTAIDNKLYLDNDRVWRLFREIIEGLSHIHLQGMIHRDLKPMNIFLDHKDHVKIGDFGLATTNLLAKPNESMITNKSYNDYGSHDGGGDPSMTGHIGTALYVAPELTSTAKAVYNQKVDIYSLGVIFFEMCYKTLITGMERINILNTLRSYEIGFPSDFQEFGTSNQEHIIRWLLDHNDSKRPTAQELLQSDKLPPPVLEECRMQELVRHTLRNSQLKAYKYLVESCFKQPVTPAQDITYDKDISAQNLMKNLHVYNKVKILIAKVFKNHGGQNLSTPLLMPKSKNYEGIDTCVKLMTHSGSIVSIPHDLRVPFARYVAWNGITSFRRYSIERVYREKKVFGFIPRELYECAFDIVTSTPGNFMADAEVLYILNEITNIVPGFKNRNLRIRLNHMNLLKAILLHCGIKDKHNEFFSLLSDAWEGRMTKVQVQMYFIGKGLSDSSIAILFNYLEMEGTMQKLEQSLLIITKRINSEAAKYAKLAVKELKTIIQNANHLGIDLNIVMCPGLVYKVQQYSGMLCQLVCEIKRKHRHGIDVIAAGGRYDGMITNYRNMMVQADMSSKDIRQSAVGVSISLDKLVSAMEKDDLNEQKLVYLDVVVCSLGSKNMIKEKSEILHSLWSVGIRCCAIEANILEDILEQCQELNVPHVIILKDTEKGFVKVRSLEKERICEKKIAQTDLIDTMQRILKSVNESNEQPYMYNALSRSDSKVSHTEHNQEANVMINYVEKLQANTRRKSENQIHTQLSNVFKKLVGDVIVFPIKMDGSLIKVIAAYLDCDSEHSFAKSVEQIKERNQKHKNSITEICDKIYDSKNIKNNAVVILYSLNDTSYKVLL